MVPKLLLLLVTVYICSTKGQACSFETIQDYNQEGFSGFGDCTVIHGSIRVQGTSDLVKLARITSISGDLHIQNNDGLESLAGLEELRTVGGNFEIITLSNYHMIGKYFTIEHWIRVP